MGSGDENGDDARAGIGLELKRQLLMAYPLILINLIFYAIVVVSLQFVGHLGVLELSCAAFANSLCNITGTTVMLGLGCGLETTCGQAYGAKRYQLLGKYLQAAVLSLLLIAVPISVIWWNVDSILIFLGQEQNIAIYTGQYLRALIPALFATAVMQPLIKYFQTQSEVLPMMILSVITLVIHIPVSYVLVFKLSDFGFGGFHGGAVAVDISYWILVLLLVLYLKWTASRASEERKTYNGLTSEFLLYIVPFLRLAVPSAFMMCVQFWGFEILTFLSGLLPNPERELSFLSICLNTAGLLFSIPLGLSAVASTRVSNELGAGNTAAAKLSMYVVMGMDLVPITIVATCLLLFGRSWTKTFSDDLDVIEYTTTAMPFLAIGTLFDGLQGVMSGVARGCGRQDLCATLNILSVYGVGLPTALILGFVLHLNARGLYIGNLAGLGTYTCILFFIMFRTNWTQMSEQAKSRVTGSQEPLLLPA